jgi:hypothetical protein
MRWLASETFFFAAQFFICLIFAELTVTTSDIEPAPSFLTATIV